MVRFFCPVGREAVCMGGRLQGGSGGGRQGVRRQAQAWGKVAGGDTSTEVQAARRHMAEGHGVGDRQQDRNRRRHREARGRVCPFSPPHCCYPYHSSGREEFKTAFH